MSVEARIAGVGGAYHDSTYAAVARRSLRLAQLTDAHPTLAKALSKVAYGILVHAQHARCPIAEFAVRTHCAGRQIVVTLDR